MVHCAIRGCRNKHQKGTPLKYFSFPKNETVLNEWLSYCRPGLKAATARVCSIHYTDSDYLVTLHHTLMNIKPTRLKLEAVPSLHLPEINMAASDVDNIATPKIGYDSDGDSAQSEEHCLKVEASRRPKLETRDTKVLIPVDVFTRLQAKVVELEKVKKEFEDIKKKYENLEQNMRRIFTPGQIKCLLKGEKGRVHWSDEDIAAAISLKSISLKGYQHLKTVVGIPLPSVSTLNYWTSQTKERNGDEKNNNLEEE